MEQAFIAEGQDETKTPRAGSGDGEGRRGYFVAAMSS
jgi:hypothetical protein